MTWYNFGTTLVQLVQKVVPNEQKKVCGNFLVICEKHYNFAENSRKKRKKMSQIWLNYTKQN